MSASMEPIVANTPVSAEQELANMGHVNLKLNARILARTGGDVSKAVQILQKKKLQAERIALPKKLPSPPEVTTFNEDAETLISMGFANRKQNLRVLARTKGNLEEAVAILKKASEKKKGCAKIPNDTTEEPITPIESSLDPNSTEEEKLKQLRDAGFTNDEGNRKMLKNTGGNVKVVQEFLIARAKLHEMIHEAKSERKRKRQCERVKNLKRVSKARKENPIEKTATEMKTLSLSEENHSRIPQDCTRIFIDGSNLVYQVPPLRKLAVQQREFHKAASVLEKMARKLTDISGLPTLLLFDESSRSVTEPKFELQSAAPSFTHSGTAILSKIEGERSPIVVTADEQLGAQLLQRGVTWIRPFQWLEEVAKAFAPLRVRKDRKELMNFLRRQISCE